MKARKEIADYIKQRKTDRAKIRVRCCHVAHVICLVTMTSITLVILYSIYSSNRMGSVTILGNIML